MNKEELNKILEKHRLWLNDKNGGKRANLEGVNLEGVDFEGANLAGASFEGANLTGAILIEVNLTEVNLTRANLTGTNLCGAIGNMKQVKSLFLETYPIVYTNTHLQIGCEKHSIREWLDFDDEKIIMMDGKKALNFWRKYRDFIFLTIKLSPAIST